MYFVMFCHQKVKILNLLTVCASRRAEQKSQDLNKPFIKPAYAAKPFIKSPYATTASSKKLLRCTYWTPTFDGEAHLGEIVTAISMDKTPLIKKRCQHVQLKYGHHWLTNSS